MSEPWVNIHLGTVISVSKRSETTTIQNKHGGSTHTKHFMEVFSRDDHGKEDNFELGSCNVALREGSRLLVAWGSESGAQTGPNLFVENMDTHETYSKSCPLDTTRSIGVGFMWGLFTFGALFFTSQVFIPTAPTQLPPDRVAIMAEAKELQKQCPNERKYATDAFGFKCANGIAKVIQDPNYAMPYCQCPSLDEIASDLFKKKSDELWQERRSTQHEMASKFLDKAFIVTGVLGIFVWIMTAWKRSSTLNSRARENRIKFGETLEKQSLEVLKTHKLTTAVGDTLQIKRIAIS